MTEYTQGVLLRIIVVAKSPKAKIEELPDGRLRLLVRSRAEHGEANDEVRALLGAHYGVEPKNITIVRGSTTPGKTVRISS